MTITPFLEIKCKHNYFADGNNKWVSLIASVETIKTMKELEIFLKSNEKGIVLAHSESSVDLLGSREEEVKLIFHLHRENDLFYHGTDLSVFDNSKKILQFDNLDKKPIDDGIVLLHEAEYVNEEDLQSRKDHSSILNPNTIGLISIALDAESVQKNIELTTYEIRFNRRKAFWRYYIIPSDGTGTPDFEISSIGKEQAFGKSTFTTLENGSQAIEICSLDPIDLEEDYNFSLSLKDQKAAGFKLNLPFPGLLGLRLEQNNQYYVNHYIYV